MAEEKYGYSKMLLCSCNVCQVEKELVTYGLSSQVAQYITQDGVLDSSILFALEAMLYSFKKGTTKINLQNGSTEQENESVLRELQQKAQDHVEKELQILEEEKKTLSPNRFSMPPVEEMQ